jgi:hypothetical protein
MVIEGQVQGQAGRDFLCYTPQYNQTTMCLNFKTTFCVLFYDSISILDYTLNGRITDDGRPISSWNKAVREFAWGN